MTSRIYANFDDVHTGVRAPARLGFDQIYFMMISEISIPFHQIQIDSRFSGCYIYYMGWCRRKRGANLTDQEKSIGKQLTTDIELD